MSKQPDEYQVCEPTDHNARCSSKEEGDASEGGSFHDKADMQRLGKEQELKVRRSDYYSLSRSQGSRHAVDMSIDC
jgi:hypothetical protein